MFVSIEFELIFILCGDEIYLEPVFEVFLTFKLKSDFDKIMNINILLLILESRESRPPIVLEGG